MSAKNATSVKLHFSIISLLLTPHNLSFSCLEEPILAATNVEKTLEYHGRLMMVAFDIFFLISAPHPRVIHIAASIASDEGLPSAASLINFINTDLSPARLSIKSA